MTADLQVAHPTLIGEAACLYDQLPASAHTAKFAGFTGGARFMAEALTTRGHLTQIPAGMERLGLIKYGGATLAALSAVLATSLALPWWIAWIAFVPVFYAVESRFVFAFPLALTGCENPLSTSNRMAGSMWTVTPRVMRVAWYMLTGGLRGHGFVRAWCVGCIAIVLWFDAETVT